jgi:hypothetical protein
MSQQWDEFSKSLAEPVPRRESLRRLGSVFAGAMLGFVGLKSASAAPKTDPCKSFCRCSNKRQQNDCLSACRACNSDPRWLCGNCGDGFACTDLANDVGNCGSCGHNCWSGARANEVTACFDGECFYECADGTADCGDGTCVSLWDDPDNCGACGNACSGAAPYCIEGTCSDLAPCPGGLTRCHGICRDLMNEPTFCGSSCEDAVVCGLYETCTAGVCVPVY